MSDFGSTSIRRFGNLGYGLKFNQGLPSAADVNKQYVRVEPNNDTYLEGSGATFSVYCIFNTLAFSDISNINTLLHQGYGVSMGVNSGVIRFRSADGTNDLWRVDCNTTAVTLNKTHHLCGIKKSETNSALFVNDIDIYLDNTKLTNSVSTGNLTQFYSLAEYTGSTGTIIGTRNLNTNFNLNHQGYIMQVSMFKKALSRDEVDYMYRFEGAIPETAKSSLALNLLFNENKGNTVRDYSQFKNHGTLFNYTGDTATIGSNNHFVDAYTLQPISQ